MGFWSRLFPERERGRHRLETRGSTQDWVEAFLHAQEFGALRTSMSALDEETITNSVASAVKTNGPVFALMLARLQVFSQVRFQWTQLRRGEVTELFGTRELELLERPWPGATTADLLARMEMDVTTAGNSYTRRLRSVRSGDRLVRLRPDWMYIVLGSQEDADHPSEAADLDLLGYVYKPPQGRMVELGPEEVAHYAPVPDPDMSYIGMSWVTPVFRDLQGDNLQTEHKRAFLRNAATPNLAIKFDPRITTQQIRDFRELFEEDHEGARNAYRTLYLGGGADAVPLGKDFKELDFAITQGKAESRLAAAAGVPPSWVGFSEGLQGSALNAGNFTAARRRFGDGTMQHLWENASSSLETILDPPNGAHLWFSTRGIPFLRMDEIDAAEIQNKEANTIRTLLDAGYDGESVKAAVLNQDWSLLIHSGVFSVQLQPPGSAQPTETTPNENGDQEGARQALLGGNQE
ncbi:MAG: phage portal protein [Actinobacteria bacterium]|nr:phage portal protein [Actinomycetota bacterium]